MEAESLLDGSSKAVFLSQELLFQTLCNDRVGVAGSQQLYNLCVRFSGVKALSSPDSQRDQRQTSG